MRAHGAMGFGGQRPPGLPCHVCLTPHNSCGLRAVFSYKHSVGRTTLKARFQAKLALASMS